MQYVCIGWLGGAGHTAARAGAARALSLSCSLEQWSYLELSTYLASRTASARARKSRDTRAESPETRVRRAGRRESAETGLVAARSRSREIVSADSRCRDSRRVPSPSTRPPMPLAPLHMTEPTRYGPNPSP